MGSTGQHWVFDGSVNVNKNKVGRSVALHVVLHGRCISLETVWHDLRHLLKVRAFFGIGTLIDLLAEKLP